VTRWGRRLAAAPVAAVLLLSASPGPLPAWAASSPSPSPAASASPGSAASPSTKPVAATPTPSSSATPVTTATPTATGKPSPVPSPAAAAPATSPAVAPATSPAVAPAATPCTVAASSGCGVQLLVKQVKQRLGDTMARSLAAEGQLADALAENGRQQKQLLSQIETSRAQSAQLQVQIQARQVEMQATQGRIDAERAEITRLARAQYEQPDSTLVRLMRSGSLKGWLVGAADLAAAAGRAQQLRSGLEQDLARLKDEQARQQSDLQGVAALQAKQQADLEGLQALGQRQQATSRELAVKIAETRDELRKVDRQQAGLADRISQALDQEVTQIIDVANQQAWTSVQLSLQSNPVQLTTPSAAHSTRSPFIWPMPAGQVSQGFGPSQLSFEPALGGYAHFHTGLDIAGPENHPVLVADDGQVVDAATGSSGYGNYVVVGHAGGVVTLYGHMNQILVRRGDRVKQGDAIGLEGSTGYSTGPHLHFEVRVNGVPVDPASYLPAGPPSPSRA
jgi:murein DD-endopeptidase MepM/ murein hydrolase activator NlpD